MSFAVGAPLWYQPTPQSTPITAEYVVQQGQNTAIITAGETARSVLAHRNQIREARQEQQPGDAALQSACTAELTDPATASDIATETEPQICLRRSERLTKAIPPDRYGYAAK